MTDQVLWTESLIDLIGVCAMPATKVAGLGFYVVITFSVLGDREAGNGSSLNIGATVAKTVALKLKHRNAMIHGQLKAARLG